MQPTDPDRTIIVYAGIQLLDMAEVHLDFGCFSVITGFLFRHYDCQTLEDNARAYVSTYARVLAKKMILFWITIWGAAH